MERMLLEDTEALAGHRALMEPLEGKTVMVTGASGLIGSLLVRGLLTYGRNTGHPIRVIGLVHNMDRARKALVGYLENEDLSILCQDITEEITEEEKADYIIHAACPTASRYFVEHPVETIDAIVTGTRNVLEYARKSGVTSMVFISSLEVYGTPGPDASSDSGITRLKEDDYHYIDPLDVRSSYSEGKRMAENLCAAYASEFQVPVKILRLTQTFGPGVGYNDGRVFAEFARCAVEGKDIVLHTKGETVRNYCYTVDGATAVLTALLRGADGQAYNGANMDTAISIRELADRFADASEHDIKVIIQDDADSSMGYNPVMKVELDSSKLCGLGWKADHNIDDMLSRLLKYMDDIFQEVSK